MLGTPARTGATLARLWSTSTLGPPRETREQDLLGDSAPHALAVLAGERLDRGPLPPAVRAQRARSAACGHDREPQIRSLLNQRGGELAKVGLRPARNGRVEEERVEHHVAGGRHGRDATHRPDAPGASVRARWATSSGTTSPATGTTWCATFRRTPLCLTWAAAAPGSATTTPTTPVSTSLPRRSRPLADAAARCCWPTSTRRSPSTTRASTAWS